MADTVTFVGPTGATLEIPKRRGTRGRGMPPISRIEEEVPGQSGARLRETRHGVREVAIPMDLTGDMSTLRATLRTWMSTLDPARGDGRLLVTSHTGDQRELFCRYDDGLDLVEQLATFQKAVLVFRAVDPYWYDLSDSVASWTSGVTTATFFPFFPLRLSSSEVFADDIVNNTGDTDAWPVWQITGPGSDLHLRNLTSGKTLSLTGLTLLAGETVTIDTRPGQKTVTKDDGTNLYSYIGTSSLWALLVGSNSVRIELTGATSASVVQLNFKRRFLSA
jgi:phage-related protein